MASLKRHCPVCDVESSVRTILRENPDGTWSCSQHGIVIDPRNTNLTLMAYEVKQSETRIVDGKPKKFYVGAKHIGQAIERGYNAACCRETFEEAVADAREYMHRDDSIQTVVVVQIVAFVKRQRPVVDVEMLDADQPIKKVE